MFLQGFNEYLAVFVLVAILHFFFGVLLTLWRAKKFDYDTSLKPNIILNLFWAVVVILILFIGSSNPTFWVNLVIKFCVDLFVGALIFSALYHEEYSEALRFLIVIVIILFVLYIVFAAFIFTAIIF